MTVWHCSDSVGLFWQCGIILTGWYYSDSVGLFWRCEIVLTVWDCSDGVRLFWQCGIVLSVWDCSDNVGLLWQCGIVLTVWYCLFYILSIQPWHSMQFSSHSKYTSENTWYPLRFPHKHNVRLFLTFSCFRRAHVLFTLFVFVCV
jgi:hypothetical protein